MVCAHGNLTEMNVKVSGYDFVTLGNLLHQSVDFNKNDKTLLAKFLLLSPVVNVIAKYMKV